MNLGELASGHLRQGSRLWGSGALALLLADGYSLVVDKYTVMQYMLTNVSRHGFLLLLQGLDNPFKAARYHSLVIDKDSCPEDLEVTAWCEDGTIMAVRHKKHPHIQGVQFHPESIITDNGKRIVKNFIDAL